MYGDSAIDIATSRQAVVAKKHIVQKPLKALAAQRLLIAAFKISSFRDHNGISVSELIPGQKYLLDIEIGREKDPEFSGCDTWRGGGNELYIELRANSEISLHVCTFASGEEQAIPYWQLTRELIEQGAFIQFQVTIPSVCTYKGTTDIELRGFTNTSSEFQSTLIRPIPISISGEGQSALLPDSKIYHIDPSIKTFDNIAFLRIRTCNEKTISYILQSENYSQDQEVMFSKPSVSLAEYIEQSTLPKKVFTQVREFSRNQIDEFIKGINILFEIYGSTLHLVIIDLTDAEIPWEMIELRPRQFLGAKAVVVRWTSIGSYDTILRMVPQEELIEGKVIHFLNRDNNFDIEKEVDALSDFQNEEVHTTDELQSQWKKDLYDIGLCYMACHGEFREKGQEFSPTLELFGSEGQGYSIFEYDLQGLDPLTNDDKRLGNLPVFIVNACHSGRIVSNQGYRYGMPELFLSRMARCYIGTLGAVNQTIASNIGSRILRSIKRTSNGVSLAELLRTFREEVVINFDPDSDNDEDWRLFINTFMYVYYGNPLARLKLELVNSDTP